ncbi:MAG: META domain-containing protein [Photobacterium frigidiphilum]|uniref:META domain-containing protein n=1 Tax=Photobacterium frigidiphilum TaxID=264736 RepID=UPI003003342D
MQLKLTMLATVLSIFSPFLWATSPSFDCDKASSQVEARICTDDALTALDVKMEKVYEQAIQNIPDSERSTMKAMQRGWIKGRNECWKGQDEHACVEYAYKSRIVELQVAGGLIEVPSPVGFNCQNMADKPVTVVFYNQTDPASAMITVGDDQALAFSTRTASGARYDGQNVSLWEHQGEASLEWFGTKMQCQAIKRTEGSSQLKSLDKKSVDKEPINQAAMNASNDTFSFSALKNTAYQGFESGAYRRVVLNNGLWVGEPYQPGGAVSPQVMLIGGIKAIGDLNGDGEDEAVVLLNYAPGGTGQFLNLAVMSKLGTQASGKADNIATILVGDRVRVRDLQIKNGKIVLGVVQVGPKDSICCPGEVAERVWQLNGTTLQELDSNKQTSRLSPKTLAGNSWVLESWRYGESAYQSKPITLSFQDNKFVGQSGCNRYFATVKAGKMPGDISVSPPGSTRKACQDPKLSKNESRFLKQLADVHQFSYFAGKLALSYGQGNHYGVMIFSLDSSLKSE